jgi:hypothetical protein
MPSEYTFQNPNTCIKVFGTLAFGGRKNPCNKVPSNYTSKDPSALPGVLRVE